MSELKQPKKRGLDGIYIRVKNVDTGDFESRCLSDLTKEQRTEYFGALKKQQLEVVAEHLASELRRVGDFVDIVAGDPEEEE